MDDASLQARIRAMRDGGPLPPFDRLLGLHLAHADDARLVLHADVDARQHNPVGVLHGGFVAGMMDAAMGLLVSGRTPEGKTTTNVDLHVRFHAPVQQGELECEATLVRAGRRTVVAEARIRHEGTLVAQASSTFLILRRPDKGQAGKASPLFEPVGGDAVNGRRD